MSAQFTTTPVVVKLPARIYTQGAAQAAPEYFRKMAILATGMEFTVKTKSPFVHAPSARMQSC